MAGQDLVRPSREGDQFHYHWAARRCLELLSCTADLVAVSIEGASTKESDSAAIAAGEELIDVGLYFGAESLDHARCVRYVQLKHSSRRALEPWTANGLRDTIKGFAARYERLLAHLAAEHVAQRIRFEFTTNRPIDPKVTEALADLASGAAARHAKLHQTLIDFTGLNAVQATGFFGRFSVESGEPALWAQRNLLMQEIGAYLPDADYDTPIQLKELVTRKATTEFKSDPVIRRHDVLRALKASEEQLQPAPSLIRAATNRLPREQEQEVLRALLAAERPVVIHAEAGVGKSVLAARLAASMPPGSVAVLYDCFGDGLYRNALHFRHRHRDALVQIANELAAQALCYPLIPTIHADTKMYMRAFLSRLAQAARVLRGRDSQANLCVIIDAADNAEMAAEEQREAASFVRDLIRAAMPEGVRLAFTCRTHRRELLRAPPDAREILLRPFSDHETAQHLRRFHLSASEAEIAEFAFLSSSNPRVQALALSQGQPLADMLRQLGPTPMTVERAIGDLLEAAVARLRDQAGALEASQITLMCQGLAVLRPLVPIAVLAQLSQTSESAVRSFALDLGRPLLLKGQSVHFLDEPAETWFRERFQPDAEGFVRFLDRLRPLTAQSSYAAAALPQLLLQADKLDELVKLALSGDSLPDNPLARRDVEVQRLTFALKACLQQRHYMAAAKLALKVGGECAGEARHNRLIQDNTDLAAVLMPPDRVEEIVSRRTFSSGWMGSRHAYDAGLLSGREEFSAEASSRLRMAIDWLRSWSRRSNEEREREEVTDTDRAELTLAQLRLRSADDAADFLRRWTWRRLAFDAGSIVGERLLDLGRYDQFEALAKAAGNDVWLLLGLAAEASAVGHTLPASPLARLLRLLSDRRIKLKESDDWSSKWSVLDAVRSAIELALRVLPAEHETWAALLRRYLPAEPPRELAVRFGFNRAPLLRAYALEAALRGQQLTLIDVAPREVRKHIETDNTYGRTQETETFLEEVGGLLSWYVLSAEITCGRMPSDLLEATASANKATASAESRSYRQGAGIRQTAAIEWLRILAKAGAADGPAYAAFSAWLSHQSEPLWPDTLTALCRCAARSAGMAAHALGFASQAYQALEASREDAESRAASYVRLARAILVVSPAEARIYFDRAVEIASRVGDENLERWAALLHLARAAAVSEQPRARTAYRFARVAELTYEYVARDKHFDWDGTVEAMTDLCASSALAILSRWRDRRFGDPARLLPVVAQHLMENGRLPRVTAIALAGLDGWDRLDDLKRALAAEPDPARRSVIAHIAYRYMRVLASTEQRWSELAELARTYALNFPDIKRLVALERAYVSPTKDTESGLAPTREPRQHRAPDWEAIFHDVDFGDAEALRAAYAAVRTYDPPYDFESFYREAFLRVNVGREPELIRAIAASPEFGLFQVRDLLDALPTPLPAQVSFRNAIREAVLAACSREPYRVQRHGWGALLPFEDLERQSVVSDADVVRATLQGYTAQVETLGASAFFKMVEPLAASLSPSEADEALNFGLDLLDDVLRPEDGDGPWQAQLQPPESIIVALAGYVWAGLGSPVVAERWRCAHVVRALVELNWSDFLEALMAHAMTAAAGPFVDARLEFYAWHARQWLLIGLARGGRECAVGLRPAVTLLKQCVREDHVLIRALASQALRTLCAAGEIPDFNVRELDDVNRSSLPEQVYPDWLDVEDEAVSESEAMTDDEKYYFGIDIGPYWLAPLGRPFGLTEKAIEQRARQALRRHMEWKGGGWKNDARHTRRIFGEGETYHSHGTLPKTDNVTAYHGYHALMLVAAELLKERPVRRRAEDAQNEFEEWLTEHLLTRDDGTWLADRRDPRLIAEPSSATGVDDKNWCWSVTAKYIDQMLSTDDGATVFWGHWDGGDTYHRETVSIRSALVSRAGAEALVAALQSAPDLNRFVLPSAEEEEPLQCGHLRLEGWVMNDRISARLDEGDPWAAKVYYPGPRPSTGTLATVGLAASADGRRWSAGSDDWLRSETWTLNRGYGREAETICGWRLSGNAAFLQRLFAAYPEERLVVSVAVERTPPRYGRDQDEFDSYPAPYTRYYLIGADGVAHAL